MSTDDVRCREHEQELGEFRYAAAKLIRYLIRARAKQEPTFLSAEEYAQWDLSDIANEPRSCDELLWRAWLVFKAIEDRFIPRCSGGIREEDANDPVKFEVAFFTDETAIPIAHAQARARDPINWSRLANWDRLNALREALDTLPQPQVPQNCDLEMHVTLDMAAALVSRSKRTLEKHKGKDLPDPDIKGGGGLADEWLWSNIRPWLERKYRRKLPIRIPAPFRANADRR